MAEHSGMLAYSLVANAAKKNTKTGTTYKTELSQVDPFGKEWFIEIRLTKIG